jgi:hypothetical protein
MSKLGKKKKREREKSWASSSYASLSGAIFLNIQCPT